MAARKPPGHSDPGAENLSPAQRRGRVGEDQALHYLEGQGLRLVARNVRYSVGELDIVMLDGDCLVFVEVRRRRDAGFGSPAESVTRSKQQRLIRAAQYYLVQHPHRADCRFDVIAITPGPCEARLEWIRDAFSA